MQVCQGKKSAVHLSDRGKGIWHKITFEIAGKDTVHVESVFIVFCFIQMITERLKSVSTSWRKYTSAGLSDRIFSIPFKLSCTCFWLSGCTLVPPSIKKSSLLSSPAYPVLKVITRKVSLLERIRAPEGGGGFLSAWDDIPE